MQDEQSEFLRFQMELEFIQCLSHMGYLNCKCYSDLAGMGYFDDPMFIEYLEYLNYWTQPEYSKFIIFPRCLHFLKLLQLAEFRQSCKNVNFTNFMHRQGYFHWYFKENSTERGLSPLIDIELGQNYSTLTLNRANNSNALNFEMIESLVKILQLKSDDNTLILCGQKDEFCIGDDMLWLSLNPRSISSFCENKAKALHFLKKQQKSVCVMQGMVMGSGAGLALSCKIRIATPTTVFSVPENSFGTCQDGSSGNFFANVLKFSLGLYLSLTGDTISGADVFLLGIATHYLPSENSVNKLLNELKTSTNPWQTADKYHSAPQLTNNILHQATQVLDNTFGKSNSIEKLKENLSSSLKLENDEDSVVVKFIKGSIRLIKQQCPLSLKICMKHLLKCRKLSEKDCLIQGYNLQNQLYLHKSLNFEIAVRHKLIQKSATTPEWVPDSIESIPNKDLHMFFANEEGPKIELNN